MYKGVGFPTPFFYFCIMWSATINPKVDILLDEGDNLRKPLLWSKENRTTVSKYSETEYAMWTHQGIYIVDKICFDESSLMILSKS